MLGATTRELIFVAFLFGLIALAPQIGPMGAAIGGWLHRLRTPRR